MNAIPLSYNFDASSSNVVTGTSNLFQKQESNQILGKSQGENYNSNIQTRGTSPRIRPQVLTDPMDANYEVRGTHSISNENYQTGSNNSSEERVDIDSVRWDDVVGMEEAKSVLQQILLWPMIFSRRLLCGARKLPNTVMLYGPPGTGKTLLARAAAFETGRKLFTIRPSDILSKWTGEGEKSLKSIFYQAGDSFSTHLSRRIEEAGRINNRRRENKIVQLSNILGTSLNSSSIYDPHVLTDNSTLTGVDVVNPLPKQHLALPGSTDELSFCEDPMFVNSSRDQTLSPCPSTISSVLSSDEDLEMIQYNKEFSSRRVKDTNQDNITASNEIVEPKFPLYGDGIIFIDEMDAIGPRRSSNSGDDLSSRRLLIELLLILNEVDIKYPNVLIISASNRPGDCDPALLRRFSRRIKCHLPNYAARMSQITRRLSTVQHELTPTDLEYVSHRTEGWNGADIDALINDALLMPMSDATKPKKKQVPDDTHSQDRNPEEILHSERENLLRATSSVPENHHASPSHSPSRKAIDTTESPSTSTSSDESIGPFFGGRMSVARNPQARKRGLHPSPGKGRVPVGRGAPGLRDNNGKFGNSRRSASPSLSVALLEPQCSVMTSEEFSACISSSTSGKRIRNVRSVTLADFNVAFGRISSTSLFSNE